MEALAKVLQYREGERGGKKGVNLLKIGAMSSSNLNRELRGEVK